jgi:hypothetical protein
MSAPTLDAFTRAYLTAALFTDDPDPRSGEFEEHDRWTIANIHPDNLAQAIADCAKFQAENAADIADDIERAGRDFWYTRNGHGCGFWDGDWPEDIGARLTAACKRYREVNVFGPETEDNGSSTDEQLDAWDGVIYIE